MSEKPITWSIRSSSGREHVSVKFTGKYVDIRGQVFYGCEVRIDGYFWGRFGKHIEGDLLEDFSVVLHQVHVYRNRLENFLSRLNAWMCQPSEMTVDLGGNENDFIIEIGKEDGIISSLEKPVCSIKYFSGSFQSARWAFVVDQSCVWLLIDELIDFFEKVESDG
jgi:hypothetical protein